jgi:hypothetical protein
MRWNIVGHFERFRTHGGCEERSRNGQFILMAFRVFYGVSFFKLDIKPINSEIQKISLDVQERFWMSIQSTWLHRPKFSQEIQSKTISSRKLSKFHFLIFRPSPQPILKPLNSFWAAFQSSTRKALKKLTAHMLSNITQYPVLEKTRSSVKDMLHEIRLKILNHRPVPSRWNQNSSLITIPSKLWGSESWRLLNISSDVSTPGHWECINRFSEKLGHLMRKSHP